MDRPSGQSVRTERRGGGSADTRRRLLRAAAELIAELGWGRVTTRAVAERAGLPHGTVSYHFRGKQELLTQAALDTVEQIAPVGDLETAGSVAELLPLIRNWLGDLDSIDAVETGVLLEAMRESERDAGLRSRLAAMLRDYRRVLADLVNADQRRDALPSDPTPSALATLLAAAGDGLLLHALLDPELDVVGAVEALAALLRREAHT